MVVEIYLYEYVEIVFVFVVIVLGFRLFQSSLNVQYVNCGWMIEMFYRGWL